jgi:hypothetical protein
MFKIKIKKQKNKNKLNETLLAISPTTTIWTNTLNA